MPRRLLEVVGEQAIDLGQKDEFALYSLILKTLKGSEAYNLILEEINGRDERIKLQLHGLLGITSK